MFSLELGNIRVTNEEIEWLRETCPYFAPAYLRWLSNLQLKPSQQVKVRFEPRDESGVGELFLDVEGLWVETILYEIPLLALTSEAYFKFCDKDWTHEGQVEKAYEKGKELLQAGCILSEFGSRRRRDYRTHDMVLKGLCQAAEEGKKHGWPGKLTGTSNVHLAKKYGVTPVGTVAHEWYMGVASVTDDYENANENALSFWLGCYGKGVLGIALTDTFGTPDFFRAFRKTAPAVTVAEPGVVSTNPSAASGTTQSGVSSLSETKPPIHAPLDRKEDSEQPQQSYAEVFTGVRQDSGDPKDYVRMARQFYDSVGIKDQKTIVFSDSLNVQRCLEYKELSEEHGFLPSFGVGTFFTSKS